MFFIGLTCFQDVILLRAWMDYRTDRADADTGARAASAEATVCISSWNVNQMWPQDCHRIGPLMQPFF